MIEKIRETYGRVKEYVRDLAVHTKLEIGAGAVAGAIVLGSIGHVNETQRSNFQPISFSEYEQIEDKAKNEGHDLNNLTWFYVGVNDFSSKIAEAYNWNSIKGVVPEFHRDQFATKLEQAMDTTLRIYRRNIRDFAKVIPSHARGALKDLEDLTSASRESNDIKESFDKTWRYHHTETGHWYPVTTCHSTGKTTSCSTTMHYQCDNYHHTWAYSSADGIKSSQKLSLAKQKVPQIKHLKIETPDKTNAWNEQVIRQSFKRANGRNPTEAEMLEASRFYKTGSQYEKNIGDAINSWSDLTNGDAAKWRSHLATAKTSRKTTGCHSTNGPIEYEFAQEMQGKLSEVMEHEQNITTGMKRVITDVPKLEQKIKEFFVLQHPTMWAHFPELDTEKLKGSPRKLSKEIISGARNLYGLNIPNGNTDTSYRFWVPFLYVLGGAVLGGLAGLGADALVERHVAPRFRSNFSRRD